MNHLITTLPFIVFSVAIIALLAASDPRRQQLSGKKGRQRGYTMVISQGYRKALAWSLLLPFVLLFSMGNLAGVLMYAGAITVIGWLITELPTSII